MMSMHHTTARGGSRRAAGHGRGLHVRSHGGMWLAIALLMAGCSLDGLLGADELPRDVTDPAMIRTPEGALRAYHGALAAFRDAFGGEGGEGGNFTAITGLLSDELTYVGGPADVDPNVDRRDLPEGVDNGAVADVYSRLQRVRGQASQAIALLTRFGPDSIAPLTAHMYAVQAYAEIFLADLFCSGIPLSTLDYDGDFTYKPGSTTEEVYQHALVLLDSALALAGDSVRMQHLARVGRARALLALGRFADAATSVREVPDEFRYEVSYRAPDNSAGGRRSTNFARLSDLGGELIEHWGVSVSDREGMTGLDFVSSGDPRTRTSALISGVRQIHHPSKYATDGSSPIVLASGIEARLAEAEAALWAGDIEAWLGKLNHLRRRMWTTIRPPVDGPLPDLTDPGTEAERVDLLFRERAFWLFLTGQRQGDLRRLLRHYGRTQAQIYPIGAYPSGEEMSYGSHVDAPVPPAERLTNPRYTGCISRGA